MSSEDLSYIDKMIIWCIYKVDKITINNLSSITKVSEEEIAVVVKNLIEKGYIKLDQSGNMHLTVKAFNSIPSLPDDIKNMNLERVLKEGIIVKPEPKTPPPTVEVKLPEKKGSIGMGAFATFMITVIFSFIPVIGWLASFLGGLAGGHIAKGAGRGALAGFLGILSAVIIVSIAAGYLSSLFGFGFIRGATLVGSLSNILLLPDFILAIIGGIIGGAMNT